MGKIPFWGGSIAASNYCIYHKLPRNSVAVAINGNSCSTIFATAVVYLCALADGGQQWTE